MATTIYKGGVNLYFEFPSTFINSLQGKSFVYDIGEPPNICLDLSHHLRSKDKQANDSLDIQELIGNIDDLKSVDVGDNKEILFHLQRYGINENWKITLKIDREYHFNTIINVKESGVVFVIQN